jgi:hypothetical protein
VKRGPKPAWMLDEEVAKLMELPVRLVRARARLSFFSGARVDEQVPERWWIPREAVEAAVRSRVQPFYSLQSVSRMLDISYPVLYRVTGRVLRLDDPLPPGKKIRALSFFLGTGKALVRIPESELVRLQGGAVAA